MLRHSQQGNRATGRWLVGIAALALLLISACKQRHAIGELRLSAEGEAGNESYQLAPGEHTFFHWGSRQSNQQQLEQAGAADGERSPLDQRVFQLLEQWYEQSGRRDFAGSGFYVSSNHLDSAHYGADLMIAQITVGNGGLFVPFEPNFRDTSNQARDQNRQQQLPLLAKYRADVGWHVISRPPMPSDDIQISFRRPKPEDFPGVWRTFPQDIYSEEFIKAAHETLSILYRSKLRVDAKTAEAEALLGEVALRGIAETLQKFRLDQLPSYLEDQYLQVLQSLAVLYPEQSSAARTSAVLANSKIAIDRAYKGETVAVVASAWPELDPVRRGEWLNAFRKDLDQSRAALADMMALSEALLQTGGYQQDIQRIVENILHRSANGQLALGAFQSESMPAARRLLGESAPQVVANALVAQSSLKSHYAGRVGDRSLVLRARHLLSSAPLQDAEFRQALLQSIDRPRHFTPVTSSKADFRSVLFVGMCEQLSLHPELDTTEYRLDLARFHHRLSTLNPLWAQETGVQIYLTGKVLDPTGFMSFVQHIQQMVPASANDLMISLDTISRNLSREGFTTADEQRFVTLRNTLQESARNQPSTKNPSDRLAQLFHSQGLKYRFEQDQFVKGRTRLLEPVSGSAAYSELARTYVLIDPIFVTEDLRAKQATRPYERFNEAYSVGGVSEKQPTWQNFLFAWEKMAVGFFDDARNMSTGGSPLQAFQIWELAVQLRDLNVAMLFGNVEGTGSASNAEASYDRSQYVTKISRSEWLRQNGEQNRTELSRFFDISDAGIHIELRFKSVQALASKLLDPGEFTQGQQIYAVADMLLREVVKESDPIRRAAKVLYLMPRMHPFKNGNGRLGRMWAAQILVRAGLPMPVGLPTNDFLFTEERMQLEVRKALAIGAIWQRELEKAAADGMPAERFFQERVRNRPLEALTLLSVGDLTALQTIVTELEANPGRIPTWSADMAAQIDRLIWESRAGAGDLARLDEVRRDELLRQLTERAIPALRASAGSGPCIQLHSTMGD